MYTKLTTMTWGPEDTLRNLPLGELDAAQIEREDYIQNAIISLTTNGHCELSSTDYTAERVWTDQAAAEAWSIFISDLAARNNQTCVVVISDIV